ncbi:XIAP-associated factor 1 isoform X2 [Rhinatrema bivittatum]|nr:XIAP-associated factor 1 isoform X2 [Rhinatrema bivittatum]
MKEHQEKQHKQVECKFCHQGIQQYQMETHESEECSSRPVACQFCDLDLAFSKLQSHTDSCGSRTQVCTTCNKYVMYKELASHKDTCLPRKPPDPGTQENRSSSSLCCPLCQKMIPEDRFLQHQNECNPLDKFLMHFPSKPSRKPGPFPAPSSAAFSFFERIGRPEDGSAEQEKRETFVFGKKDPFFSLEASSEPPRSAGLLGRLTLNAPLSLQDLQAPEDPTAYDTFETCAGCNILLPSPTLKQHEKKCLHLVSLQSAM